MTPIDPLAMTHLTAPASGPKADPRGLAEAEGANLGTAARDFEAAFIAQMLAHSGLADAMTSGEGKMASAFGSFYIEALADRMADQGGLGLADSIYGQLERYAQGDALKGDGS